MSVEYSYVWCCVSNAGHQVFAGFRSLSSDRDQERINSLKNEVTSSSNIIPVAIDVTDQESISRAVEEVRIQMLFRLRNFPQKYLCLVTTEWLITFVW